MKFCLSILFIAFFAVFADGQKTTVGNLTAFAVNPAGDINIRADAGKDFKVISNLPGNDSLGKPDAAENSAIVAVSGAKGDWLKVTSVKDKNGEPFFIGEGWVFAPLLAVREKRDKYEVFTLPNRKSKKIEIGLFDHILPLHGCQGDWAKVRLPVTGTGVGDIVLTGWMPSGTFCGNPWAKCE